MDASTLSRGSFADQLVHRFDFEWSGQVVLVFSADPGFPQP
jgi:hypothetical protein